MTKSRRVLRMLLALLLACGAEGQQGFPGFIESRQAEVARMASLNFIDLSRGDWKQVQVDPCPAFTHHAFTRYERSAAPGVVSSFLAIYPLIAVPATPGKPWKSGIFLIPSETFGVKPQPLAERRTTQVVFNQVWSDELNAGGHPGHFPLKWEGWRTATQPSPASVLYR